MTDTLAADVSWDLTGLTGSDDPREALALLDRADQAVAAIEARRGALGSLDAPGMAALVRDVEVVVELLERAGNRAFLDFAVDSADPARGALVAAVQERSTAVGNRMLFVDLEWAALPDDRVEALLADPALAFCAHHLRVLRQARPYLLTEPEERVMAEKATTGIAAWTRLFDEQMAELTVDLGGDESSVSLETALARIQHLDRSVRQGAASAITASLKRNIRTRAYIYNNVLADKSIDDRLRRYPSWVSSRNLANQASDESVRALIEAVTARNDIPRRWYSLKAQVLGLDRIAYYDRAASLATSEQDDISWDEARSMVLDAYGSFSPDVAAAARRFFDERWIDAPVRPSKRGGAFCSPGVPSLNPFVLLNYTGTRNDVLTLAHELGHGIHNHLSRGNSILQYHVPLTVAETASVFGETVTFGRLLDAETDPAARFALLAENIEGQIATTFRQVAMWRFEDLAHTARRERGELSVDDLNGFWLQTQGDLLGDTVDLDGGYDVWWSYIGHFVHVPGYVYAYAFGNLLALSVYQRYRAEGPSFVPRYLAMLSAGGSRSPEDLAAMVGCDLRDPGFWSAGLDLVEDTLVRAQDAAKAAGRVN